MSFNDIPEWVESRYPLYAAESIQSLYISTSQPPYPIKETSSVLIAIVGGSGNLQIGEKSYVIREGSLILLPAGMAAVLHADQQHTLHAYSLAIGARGQQQSCPSVSGGEMMRDSMVATGSAMPFYGYEPDLAALVEELYVHRSPVSEVRHVMNQIRLHQILLGVLELQQVQDAGSQQPSMERSLAYLESHFSDRLTRDELAQMAGVSSSHYSILFKQQTGFSPNEYLSRLRIHRAKELLLSGSGTLREIALKAGYKDEFYFSRRFKQQTGMPPSSYGGLPPQRVAVMMTPYASHLLLLGLEPTLIISDNSEYVNADGVQPPQGMRFLHAGSSVEQVKTALLKDDIELLLADSEHLTEHGLSAAQLRAAAPIFDIPWMGYGWKEHLRLIAGATRRGQLAEAWLAAFEEEERAARARLQSSRASNEVITILVVKPDRLLVYGARNVGYVLYRSLGMKPPARIRQEMDRLGDRLHSIPIGLSELADYAGDRILAIVFPDAKGSTAHSEAVWSSSEWRELPAVRRHDVHHLELDDWVPYNPVSISLQLQRAESLLAGN